MLVSPRGEAEDAEGASCRDHFQQARALRIACGGYVVGVIIAGWTSGLEVRHTAIPIARAQQATSADGDYGYANRYLTPEQREGRDTWYFWTGGNEQFWVEMARITEGNVSLLNYVDSRRHGRRFRELGAITQPGCEAATAPDQYGLWMDQCDQPPVPGVPGDASGIVGLRKFPNPKFDKSRWDAAKYLQNPGEMQPPYLIGMTCGFCHIGFNPTNPPANPERATWGNLAATIGNQYWEEGRLFNLNMKPDDFRWHVAARQPPGTSDTSRFATDHINNPNAINTIFNLSARPTEPERMRDGTTVQVHHILKDGADSIGVAGASLRVLREHRNVRRLLAHPSRCRDWGCAAPAAVRDRLRAQELSGLAQHRSANGQRRGLSEDDEAAVAQGCAGRSGVSDGIA